MKLIFILIFIILEFLKTTNAVYACTNSLQTIKVNKTDELIFFESNDFPKPDTSDNCLMNFVLENATKSMRGSLIISVQIAYSSIEPHIFVYENVLSILFDNKRYNMLAFRGYVLFDDWGGDCPLESISRVDPYQFTDESQVIYLQSSYYPNNLNISVSPRKHPCLWQFLAPPDYGFKYVIQGIHLAYSTRLNIENSTEILQTERNVRSFHPYYNKDNYLKFYLYGDTDTEKLPPLVKREFRVKVSIFKNEQKKVDGGCKIIRNGLIDTWANLNDNGYPNNAKCSYDLIIPSGHLVYVGAREWYLEKFDIVSYFDSSENETGIIENYFDSKFFYGNQNAEDKIVNWTFTSDASIYSLGFSIHFYKYGWFFFN